MMVEEVIVMSVQEISTLIGNLGFPIVACCVMFYLYYQLSQTVAGLNTTIEKLYTLLDERTKGEGEA